VSPGDDRFLEWLELRAEFVQWQGWFDADHTAEEESDIYDDHAATQQMIQLMDQRIVCGVRWTRLKPAEVNPTSMLTLKMMSLSSLAEHETVQQVLRGETHHLGRWLAAAKQGRLLDLTRFVVRRVDSRLPGDKRRRMVRRQKAHYARLFHALASEFAQNSAYRHGCTMVFATSPKFVKLLTDLGVKVDVIAEDDTNVFGEVNSMDIRHSFRHHVSDQTGIGMMGNSEAIRAYGSCRKLRGVRQVR